MPEFRRPSFTGAPGKSWGFLGERKKNFVVFTLACACFGWLSPRTYICIRMFLWLALVVARSCIISPRNWAKRR